MKNMCCEFSALGTNNEVTQFSILSTEIYAANFHSIERNTLLEIYSLRKKAFIDRRGWDIQSYDGSDFELDRYDNDQSYYLFSWDEGVTGCVRLRPSRHPTLTADSFWHIKKVAKAIDDLDSTWEASRFFVAPKSDNLNPIGKTSGGIDNRTLALFMGMLQFGNIKNIQAYEVVTDAMMFRVLRRCGWNLEICSTGFGSKGEKIYYGLLHCGDTVYKSMMRKAAIGQ